MSADKKLSEAQAQLSKALQAINGLDKEVKMVFQGIETADCELFGRKAKVSITVAGKIMIDFCDKKGTKEDLQKIVDQCQLQ